MASLRLEHQTGRVVALGRLLLAAFYLAATLAYPAGAGIDAGRVALILFAYFLLALLFVLLSWNRWSVEYRTALAALGVDLCVFAALMLLGGGPGSPFFGLALFPIVAAAMRWRARQAALAVLLVLLVLLASARIAPLIHPVALDPMRLAARAGLLLVLAGMVLWFWSSRTVATPLRIDGRPIDAIVSAQPPARDALLYAAERLSAGRAQLFWNEADEPWLNILAWSGGEPDERRVGPEEFPDPLEQLPAERPYLFDRAAGRLLMRCGDELRMERGAPFADDVAERIGVECGLAIPIRTSRYEALLVADRIPGLCAEFLDIAAVVGDQVASAFERAGLIGSMQAANAAAGRLTLARNLHDGAIQFLAGMALKVRSMKEQAADPAAIGAALDEIETELVRQQHDVRAIIQHLRAPQGRADKVDFRRAIQGISGRLRTRWGIEIDACAEDGSRAGGEMMIAAGYRYQLEQMIGEAASNAVRHGGARRLKLRLSRQDDELRLEIEDDGNGFPFTGLRTDEELWQRRLGPLSLHERVRALGGTLAIASSRTGSTLSLLLPLEEPN